MSAPADDLALMVEALDGLEVHALRAARRPGRGGDDQSENDVVSV